MHGHFRFAYDENHMPVVTLDGKNITRGLIDVSIGFEHAGQLPVVALKLQPRTVDLDLPEALIEALREERD